MEERDDRLREACLELRELIDKEHLDNLQKQIDEHKKSYSTIDRLQIEKAGPVAAFETRKHILAHLQGGLKASDCQPSFIFKNKQILISLARMWQTRSKTEIQELLVEEKLKQTSLKEERQKILVCLNENKQLLEVHLKEKMSLENKQEDLESQRILELEEKLAIVKRAHGEMKFNLENTVIRFFPEPTIPGFTGMYILLKELTQRLQDKNREAYIEVKNTHWPYFLEILQANGIVERHPTDQTRIRMVDFSDGRLGL